MYVVTEIMSAWPIRFPRRSLKKKKKQNKKGILAVNATGEASWLLNLPLPTTDNPTTSAKSGKKLSFCTEKVQGAELKSPYL